MARLAAYPKPPQNIETLYSMDFDAVEYYAKRHKGSVLIYNVIEGNYLPINISVPQAMKYVRSLEAYAIPFGCFINDGRPDELVVAALARPSPKVYSAPQASSTSPFAELLQQPLPQPTDTTDLDAEKEATFFKIKSLEKAMKAFIMWKLPHHAAWANHISTVPLDEEDTILMGYITKEELTILQNFELAYNANTHNHEDSNE